MEKNQSLTKHKISEISNIKIHGRTRQGQSPVPLFFNGSAVEANVSGSELWIDIEADFDFSEPWATIWLNGAMLSRLMLQAGRYPICLFRGMNPETVKNVIFMRETEAEADDEACHVLVHGFEADGFFHPVPEKKLKIEFVGDSITSGAGAYGATDEMDYTAMFKGSSASYPMMVAKAFDADFRCLSQSGWGIVAGYDNNPGKTIPAHYEMVCALAKGAANEALGANKPHDFTTWQPDAIIVNLGTNDDGAFGNPEWADPATNEIFKLRGNSDGTYHADDLAKIENAIIDFLTLLRKNNEKAHLVWAYGMAGQGLAPMMENAIARYQSLTDDRNVAFILLPDTTAETMGSLMHPGEKSHRCAADVLIRYLRSACFSVCK